MQRHIKVLIATGSCLLLLMGFGAFRFGRPVWRNYKEGRAATRAEQYCKNADAANAALCARQALALNASNLTACRVMATLAERASAPQLLDWRKRIAEIDPTAENLLQLAAASLRLQPAPCPIADKALRQLPPEVTNLVRFQVLSAELALKQNRPGDARARFMDAARLEPGNPLHTLNTAALDLSSTNPVVATAARKTLLNLCDSPRDGDNPTGNPQQSGTVSVIALRWLVSDACARNDLKDAERLSTRLVAAAQSTLDDCLQHLSILLMNKHPELNSFLTNTQARVTTNAPACKAIASWMINHDLAAPARVWLDQLPPMIRSQVPVRLAIADCYIGQEDWGGLAPWLEKENWGESEYMRLALSSQASFQQRQTRSAQACWGLAVHAAGDRFVPLMALADFASRWKREKDRIELLWRLTQRFPNDPWAWLELDRFLSQAGDTRQLRRLYSARLAQAPSDSVARNNYAALSMLVHEDMQKAFQIAEQLYAERSNDPVAVSTYAFSLHLQKRTKEGLAALEKIGLGALFRHPVALYYAVLLSADGQSERAQEMLRTVEERSLLPEERAMLESVKL